MLFNSIDFAIFLLVVFFLYWFIFNKKLLPLNLLLIFSSYFFYASLDYMFLILIFFSSVLDYFKVKRFLLDSNTDYVYLKPKGLELFSKTLINDIKKIINEK